MLAERNFVHTYVYIHIFTTDQDVKVFWSALLKINLVEYITKGVA